VRRSLIVATGLVAIALVGCSSGDSISIEVFPLEGAAYGTGPSQTPFRTSGAAVDEAIVCENGTMIFDHFESPEGQIITGEELGELIEVTRAAEGVIDLFVVDEFVCDDGSGTFTMRTHTGRDYAKTEVQEETRSWEIESGTGNYAALSGSGEVPQVFGDSPGEATTIYTGDVQSG